MAQIRGGCVAPNTKTDAQHSASVLLNVAGEISLWVKQPLGRHTCFWHPCFAFRGSYDLRKLDMFERVEPVGMVFLPCSSGLSSDARHRLEASVAELNGVCTPDLTDQTTHLVAESVTPRSRKLACARRLGLPVVRASWIHDSAARGALLPLAEGLLPPLAGVVLCVSGISFHSDERESVEAAVENAGGRFSRVLDASTTHLLTSGGQDGGAKDEALLALSAAEQLPVLRVTPMW